MKTTVTILSLSMIFIVSSCKKEYTCRCTASRSNVIHDEIIKAGSAAEAGKKCESRNKPEIDGFRNCHILLK